VLSPPALLAARLIGVWAASAVALALINWASHAPQLAAAEAQLEAEAERVEEELEESLRRAGVHLPALSGRLLHAHLAHPFRSFVLGTAALAAVASIAAAASPALAAAAVAPLLRGWRVFGVACATWLAVFQEQLVFSGLARASPADAGTLGVLSTLAQRATLGAGALAALHVMGVPLAALLTFGGVSGLAIGLAAQVAAANLVAGASLLVAQPFRVGDKVEVLGRGLVGFVTRFALDNTQLQLEDTTIVTLPNAELAKAAVRNLTRMAYWRVAATLRVPLHRAPDVRRLAAKLEAHCRSRPDFAEEPPRVVARVVLGDVAADHLPINVTTFFRAPGVTLAEFERRRHDILLALTDILAQEGVPLQLPASTVSVTNNNAAGGAAASDAGGSAVPMV
jgi:small-conductance mechanosensitive channel